MTTPPKPEPGKPARNLQDDRVPAVDWSDAGRGAALRTWHDHAEAKARTSIEWYFRQKGLKSLTGSILRFLAILLASLGLLAPVLAGVKTTLFGAPIDGQLGFLFLGGAGCCVALDRFFGWTTAWIRYVSAALQLQKLLTTFRLDWAKNEAALAGATATKEHARSQLEVAGKLLLAVHEVIATETGAWALEFQRSLDKSVRALLDEAGKEAGAGRGQDGGQGGGAKGQGGAAPGP